MGAHETADTVLTQLEADWLRQRALELVAELDTIASPPELLPVEVYTSAVWRWAGSASVILKELARG